MALKTLSAKNAAAFDKELMSSGAFSIDQLMELAGLSVSQAVYRLHPPNKGSRILVACGPGNNGGDGLVAARHLWHYGYKPMIYYPKQSKNELYQQMIVGLMRPHSLHQEITDPRLIFSGVVLAKKDFPTALANADHVVDAIFGFSFSGEIREPFPSVIVALERAKVAVTSVDAPSSWDIEDGPPKTGPGMHFNPTALVSLTAPKPLVRFFKGRHFLGGRFVSQSMANKYDLDIPNYIGVDQVVEIGNDAQRL